MAVVPAWYRDLVDSEIVHAASPGRITSRYLNSTTRRVSSWDPALGRSGVAGDARGQRQPVLGVHTLPPERHDGAQTLLCLRIPTPGPPARSGAGPVEVRSRWPGRPSTQICAKAVRSADVDPTRADHPPGARTRRRPAPGRAARHGAPIARGAAGIATVRFRHQLGRGASARRRGPALRRRRVPSRGRAPHRPVDARLLP